MNELKAITGAYEKAVADGIPCALATVVQVQGSSYRRPGARMLITRDGKFTGAISGGCLEGDVLKKAQFAIYEQENKLVTYDSTDDDDSAFGIQLGCNGIVDILIEPINDQLPLNPLKLVKLCLEQPGDTVLLTLFSSPNRQHPGTQLLVTDAGSFGHVIPGLESNVLADAQRVLARRQNEIKKYGLPGEEMNALLQYIPRPFELLIAGAGNDIQPLVRICTDIGWRTTVVDGRPMYARRDRFPTADRLLVCKPAELLQSISPALPPVFLLMTHNYNYDLALLAELINTDCAYIGILGPASKKDRLLRDLDLRGIEVSQSFQNKLYAPVGLDIGAETAEEIALSIVAEIKAVFALRKGGSLKFKTRAIHAVPDNPFNS